MDKKGRWEGARFQREGFTREASKVLGVKVEESYHCNSDYELELCLGQEVTPTGLLIIAKLKPKRPSRPEFCFRWDEKANQLDVDMEPKHEDWKKEKNGYEGHHPEKVDPKRRVFRVSIKIPGIDVFQGIINLSSLSEKVKTGGTLRPTGKLQWKIIRRSR